MLYPWRSWCAQLGAEKGRDGDLQLTFMSTPPPPRVLALSGGNHKDQFTGKLQEEEYNLIL